METKAIRLSSVFYAPKYNEMLPLMIEAFNTFKYKSDATAEGILMRIITNYWADYNANESLAQADEKWGKQQGDFNIKSMLKEINIFLDLAKLCCVAKSKYSGSSIGILGKDKMQGGIKHLYTPCQCTHEDESVFALAIGDEIIHTSDNDCYETAGGYRCYESADKPIVYLSVGHYGISLIVESWLTIDHYNNNFFGVSTGNGTTRYDKSGKSVKRTINTMSYNLGEVLDKYKLNLKKMDCDRLVNQLKQYDIY